eukprot:COSAG05_NODE_16337_length_348_cov_0.911647_2_plen_26_part_01
MHACVLDRAITVITIDSFCIHFSNHH